MDEVKKDWLRRLNQKAVLQQRFSEQQQQRAAILSQLAGNITSQAEKLFENTNLLVSDGSTNQRLLNYGYRDQTTEFDLDEQSDGFRLRNEEDEAKHLEYARMIIEMSHQLDVMVDQIGDDGLPTGNQVPLFSKEDIARDFYQPLVRAGLMPETFVPDEYSETREMLDGSFDAYAARLEREGEDKKSWLGKITDGDSTAFSVFTTTLSIAGHVTNCIDLFPDGGEAAAWATQYSDAKGHDVAEFFEWTAIGLNTIPAATSLVKTVADGEDEAPESPPDDARTKKAKIAAGALVSGMAAALGASLDEVGFAVAASAGFNAAVKPAHLLPDLVSDPVQDAHVDHLVTTLATGFERALLFCDPGVDATDEAASTTDVLRNVGTVISQAFSARVNRADVKSCLEDEAFSELVKLLLSDAEAAVAGDAIMQPLTQLYDAHAKEIQAAVDQQLSQEFDQQLQEQQLADQREQERLAQTKDPAEFAGLLEQRIRSLERENKIVSQAASIVGLGLDYAAKCIAPLAIAGKAISVAANVLAAVNRERDLHQWLESQHDMVLAASAYSSPIANFVKNASLQAVHYEINAALDFVSLVGVITECTGVGAAVGKAIQASASAMGAVEALLYEMKQKKDIEKGWQMYRLALLRPENRKIGLKAIRKNPTLAKYSVAWGAVIKRDPLVADFMSTCGLTEHELKDPTANLDKVVRYLEARMPDDSVLVGRSVLAIDWVPQPIELSLAYWTSVKKRGETKADLKPIDTRSLEADFSELDRLYPPLAAALSQGDLVEQERRTACLEVLDRIYTGLSAYTPYRICEDQERYHRDMDEVIRTLQSLVKDRQQEIRPPGE